MIFCWISFCLSQNLYSHIRFLVNRGSPITWNAQSEICIPGYFLLYRLYVKVYRLAWRLSRLTLLFSPWMVCQSSLYKKVKAFKILKSPHETFVLWLGQKWKCIFDFKKWWLTVAIFTAYYSDKRIVDFIISISNSTWLEAEGTCQAMNGTLWGEDKLDLLLYLRILAHQKISWYKLY